ncbi:MAG: UDP-3-O-acyl-N-acetylglucosamine deacetylase [Rickettsiales bacterium]|jgi:UDP-3-O-[3-hydroxymyristoyl] N-acetylglucosamine deacetylase|nr:UDP-3-O-acyl-N-acetylglucosamine deacetylase [Rickettsiales bacterium]
MATIKKQIKITGVGIHSGAPVTMIINPSDARGIFFHRADIGGGLISAAYDNVGDNSLRNTTVGTPPNTVSTIEHLMAALFMSGIDSAIIEIDGSEVPIMDGSALGFYKLLSPVAPDYSPARQIIVKREIVVKKREVMRQISFIKRMFAIIHDWFLGRRNNGYVHLTPDSRGLVIDATFDYPDKIIGRQSMEYIFDGTQKSVDDFVNNIASARTFGRYSEWEYLKKRGMARGANEGNVIALNDRGDGTINKLQWPDEFVRHQVVDVLGDMFTSGGVIVGRIKLYKGGHAMSNLVLRKLFSDPENYDII